MPHRGPEGATDTFELSRALEATVERFQRLIFSVARGHGLPDADVDEVIQEVRLRLWRHRGDAETLREVGASYVYKTAVSAALDLRRARRARRTGLDAVAPLDETMATHGDDPVEHAERNEMADQVFAAVARLSDSRRPVVRMHLAGYEREEIARALGWTVGKVRNLLSRGLVDLRAELAAGAFNSGGD